VNGRTIVTLLVALFLGAGAVAAEPDTGAGKAPAGTAPAVERLAEAFAEQVASAIGEVRGDDALALSFRAAGEGEDAPAAGELGRLVAGLLPSRLRARCGFSQVVEVPPGDRGFARAQALGARAHLDVQLHRVGDELLLTGLYRPAWMNFWTGEIRGGEPKVVDARVRADAAARLLLRASAAAPPSRGALQLRPLLQLAGRPVSIAVGDLTGDGRGEIVVLLEAALVIFGHDAGGNLVEIGRRDLSGRPRALVPSRDPAGGVAVTRVGERRVIAYHHTGLAEGEVLGWFGRGILRPITTLAEHPIAASRETIAYGRPQAGTNRFEGSLRVVGPGGTRRMDLGGPILAAAVDDEGRLLAVDAAFRLVAPGAPSKEAGGGPVGAALALARLGDEGGLLRIGTVAAPPSGEDRLVLAEFSGVVQELRPVPGAVRALATGDVTGRGRDEVVVLTGAHGAAWVYLLAEAGR
jgi:hypothetical protein